LVGVPDPDAPGLLDLSPTRKDESTKQVFIQENRDTINQMCQFYCILSHMILQRLLARHQELREKARIMLEQAKREGSLKSSPSSKASTPVHSSTASGIQSPHLRAASEPVSPHTPQANVIVHENDTIQCVLYEKF
jgi:hypothetical protein